MLWPLKLLLTLWSITRQGNKTVVIGWTQYSRYTLNAKKVNPNAQKCTLNKTKVHIELTVYASCHNLIQVIQVSLRYSQGQDPFPQCWM